MESKKPHVILVASPGMGHLKPMLELGKRLVNQYNLEITLFIISNESKASSGSDVFKSSSSEFFHIHLLTAPIQNTASESAGIIEKLVRTMRSCIPLIRSVILDMSRGSVPTAIIVDLFGTDFWNLADEFRMLKFAFMTTSAYFLAALISVPFFVENLSRKEFDSIGLIDIPGCKPVSYEDVFDLANRANPDHVFAKSIATNFVNADGVLINSWNDLEPNTFKQLRDGRLLGTVYPIGPLAEQVAADADKRPSAPILEWLDKQPQESVLYISFGSALSLSYQQIHEIAFGLESSNQRFVWVSRPPADEVAEYFFVADNTRPKLDYLPEGFLERTKDIGLVVPMWAPQPEILAHSSIGGFLTHCGWNSTIESITNGIPLIAWPLYADQHIISKLLADDLKVAIKTSKRTALNGPIIDRAEIQEMVVTLMEGGVGKLLRSNVKELQRSGEMVLKAQKSGSSLDPLHHFTTSLRSWKAGQMRSKWRLVRCLSCCLKSKQP